MAPLSFVGDGYVEGVKIFAAPGAFVETCGDAVFPGIESAGTLTGEAVGCKDETKLGPIEECKPEDLLGPLGGLVSRVGLVGDCSPSHERSIILKNTSHRLQEPKRLNIDNRSLC